MTRAELAAQFSRELARLQQTVSDSRDKFLTHLIADGYQIDEVDETLAAWDRQNAAAMAEGRAEFARILDSVGGRWP